MAEKFKSYRFWIAFLSAIVLVVQNLAKQMGFEVSDEVALSVANSICSLLVFVGIIDKPAKKGAVPEEENDVNAEFDDEGDKT